MHLAHDGDVAVLHLGADENRFDRSSIDQWHATVDELSAASGPIALVATGDGKYWSNGLDLAWLTTAADPSFMVDVHRLFARVLTLPMITVAALNGHAFAAGAMLSLSFDRRLMRADRGWWCLPEVDLGLPLTYGMDALVTHRLPTRTAHDAIVTGHRYTAPEALEAQIVDATASSDTLLDEAIAMAGSLADKAGPALGTIKQVLHRSLLQVLEDPSSSTAPPPGT